MSACATVNRDTRTQQGTKCCNGCSFFAYFGLTGIINCKLHVFVTHSKKLPHQRCVCVCLWLCCYCLCNYGRDRACERSRRRECRPKSCSNFAPVLSTQRAWSTPFPDPSFLEWMGAIWVEQDAIWIEGWAIMSGAARCGFSSAHMLLCPTMQCHACKYDRNRVDYLKLIGRSPFMSDQA